MNKKIITFGHNENKKHKVHRYKNTILLEDEDIDNIDDILQGFFWGEKLEILY